MTASHLSVDPQSERQVLLDESEAAARPRSRLTVAAVLGIFVVACTALAFARTGKHAESYSLARAAVKLAENVPMNGTKPCAKADVEDCSQSQCCQDVGFQCYQKQDGWALCKKECDSAEMKKYDPKHEEWDCKTLGERARCAVDGENCKPHGCCQSPGTVCYEKADFWGVCMDGCDAAAMQKSDPNKEEWSCKEIGARNDKPVVFVPMNGTMKCAKAEVEDCTQSQCCRDAGFQCYEKKEGWSVCKEECDSKEMKKYDPAHEEWSCKKFGERAHCGGDGENCKPLGCCQTPGQVCYEKGDYWGACMDNCDAAAMQKNDPNNEAWSCKEIGDRNYKSKCSWAGQDCSQSKCCNNNGFTCAVKDDVFAGCTLTTKKSTWFAKKVPIPEGWDGTILGGSRQEYAVDPVPQGQPIQGNGLFCVMVYLPNSTEESLMWLAKKNGVSIFGCNESMVLHSWKSAGGEWDTGETTLINTDVFYKAFETIKEDGRYLKWDWTVKADPDCVFFADRLMGHLWGLRAPPYVPVYIKNNGVDPGLGNNGFLGAIEIFSQTAMKTYFANSAECLKFLGTDCGEDGYFKGCMDALGVGFMKDENIFTPDYDPHACANAERVAFHPIKTYKEYQCCVDIVYGIKRNPVYGKCDDDKGDIKRPWYKETE